MFEMETIGISPIILIKSDIQMSFQYFCLPSGHADIASTLHVSLDRKDLDWVEVLQVPHLV